MRRVLLTLVAAMMLLIPGALPGLALSQFDSGQSTVTSQEHPNIYVLQRFDPTNIAGSIDVLAEDVVWHFFNPLLPDIQGDYVGLTGLQTFFEKLGGLTDGTFKVNPISATAVGDELVVVHTENTMILEDQQIETDVVVVWRVVNGRITEVWDIPSVHASQDNDS